MGSFTAKEKRRFRMRKYIREHVFDFCLELMCNSLFTVVIVYLCGGANYARGVLLAAAYTVGRAAYSLRWYQKDYLSEKK